MDSTLEDKQIFPNQVKTHADIMKMLDEVKDFEKKIPEYEIEEEVEFVEIETIKPQQDMIPEQNFSEIKKDESLPEFKEIEKPVSKGLKKIKIKAHQKSFKQKTKKKPPKPATFRLGFNEKGELINLDLRKIKKKSFSDSKIYSLFRKITGKKTSSDQSGKKGISKLKGVLGKIPRVKK